MNKNNTNRNQSFSRFWFQFRSLIQRPTAKLLLTGLILSFPNASYADPVGIAGDINSNSMIDGSEIAGDVNLDGIINNGEICGDVNGSFSIDGNEKAGDKNGNENINTYDGEIAGDLNGDYHINSILPELEACGDINASGTIDGNNYVDMNINFMSLTCLVRGGNWYLI